MIEVDRVQLRAGGKLVVDDVSFAVPAGRVTALVGPNGSGKSTLLRAVGGELQACAGEVRIGGQRVDQWTRRELATFRAVLPQTAEVAFRFSALEVVLLGRLPHRLHGGAAKDLEVAAATLALVEATHLASQAYPTLSGGERQRVQMARVLAQLWTPPAGRTRYLLLDEPTNNLDVRHQHQVLAISRALARSGAAVLLVLHDLNLAARYADDAVVLAAGRTVAAGPIAESLNGESIEKAFGFPVEVVEHPRHGGPLILDRLAPGRGPQFSEIHSPSRR